MKPSLKERNKVDGEGQEQGEKKVFLTPFLKESIEYLACFNMNVKVLHVFIKIVPPSS